MVELLRDRLRHALNEAMKARDAVSTSALRSALGAIDNAEAVDADIVAPMADGPIAGAVSGLGAGELPRRTLSDADVAAIVHAEVEEREAEARSYEGFGRADEAERLRAEAEVLRRQLTIYDAAGGIAGLTRLAHAWHDRVLADEIASHAFSHGFRDDHTDRLAAYWAEALGGPAGYSASYGDETAVVRIHSGNGPHEEMDRRAIACFDLALEDAGLVRDVRLRTALHDYFAWATTATMARYHRSADDVPDDLTVPQWSWDGLVT
jgi:hemoglobin